MDSNGDYKEDNSNGSQGGGHTNSRDHAMDHHEMLHKVRTEGSISMTPEIFERLYLQPQTKVKGDLVKTFANPTPLAVGGFVVALTPLSCQLMNWRGSGQLGAATIGVFYFIGGPCLWLGAILEFFLGNTFSFVVFFIYGGILFGWAATLQPFFDSTGHYTTSGSGDYWQGIEQGTFWSSLAFWPLFASLLSLIFMIGATRVNLVFVLLFFTVTLAFALLAGAFWKMGLGEMAYFIKLCRGTGGTFFATSMMGWYLFLVQILDAVGFKWPLPVGDFSGYWAKREERKAVGAHGGEA